MTDLIVLDTNVFINAIFEPKEYPNDLLILKLESQAYINLAFSAYTKNELFKIMTRFINDESIFECADFFIMLSTVIERSRYLDVPNKYSVISNDGSDQNFINLAIDIGAKYFITNDLESGILQKKEFNGVKFLTPFQYIQYFYQHSSSGR